MQSQQQIKENKFKSRIQRFEKIWNEAEGSDFDKALTMLHAYCAYSNWGTHADAVWSGISDYYGTTGSRTKNKTALRYTLPYLFLQLSYYLSYAKIKPDGDLAAIFAVIKAHTNFNPYDFDQATEIYSAYSQRKDQIRQLAEEATGWKNLLSRLGDGSQYFAYILLKAKLIDHVDGWEFMVESHVDQPVFMRCINQFDKQFPIKDEDLREIFNSHKALNLCHYMQYLYGKKYNLEMRDYYRVYPEDGVTGIIRVLCGLSGDQPVDGVLLLDLVKKISDAQLAGSLHGDSNEIIGGFYDMFIALIEKRHLIANWNEIEEILINNKCINFSHFFLEAIEKRSLNAINYLLKEKKNNIDIMSPCKYGLMTPLQIVVDRAKCFAKATAKASAWDRRHGRCNQLPMFRDLVKILIEHNPDCARAKDNNGNDIFTYLDHTLKILKDGYKDNNEAVEILDDIYDIIYRAYYRRQAFAFFSGRHDKNSPLAPVPPEVLGLIAEKTLNDITIKKSQI